jgi:4-hydroxy-2-oxoheptanedioate aldolase
MIRNLLREKLEKGGVAFGALIEEPATQIAEILGLLGFDYLYIDCQHSPMSLESVAQLVKAAELRGMTPLVRVPQNLPEIIIRYLDMGAIGIIVADMDSVEEAQKAVRAAKYPPKGQRGLSPARAADFGLKESLGDYVMIANRETMVLGMIESKEGVERIDEILGTEGLDGVSIGTTDLSKSLGVPGQRNDPVVLEAVNKVILAARKRGKFIAISARRGENPKQYIEKGFNMITKSLSTLVVEACHQFLEQARG